MYIAIANHILNMVRDTFAPYGYPNSSFNWCSSWLVSLLFMSPLIFTSLEQTVEGCKRCTLIEPSLGKMWMFQWSEQVYVAILPLLAIWFYHNKYAEHPDYEAVHKAGNRDQSLRDRWLALPGDSVTFQIISWLVPCNCKVLIYFIESSGNALLATFREGFCMDF